MRVNYDSNIEVQGNLGESTQMTFDEDSIEHIMAILTDLYSDPATAVVREYATNAYDSHKAAGNPNPIEVTLPSNLSPWLRIKDYGVGMSVDDINNIYSKYGASTKRDNDDEAGMLGLGCKSALSYTNQFYLTSVKNGVKIKVLVTRTERGTGSIEISDTVSTDEPNGVEVVISSRDTDELRRACNNIFKFWEPGTVLVNGEEPEKVDGLWISDNILIRKKENQFPLRSKAADYIVMGNVPYPAEERLSGNLNFSYSVVAWVPMGSVHFPPSRDSLRYTDRTNNTINEIVEELNKKLFSVAQQDVDSTSNATEAWLKAHEWADVSHKLDPNKFTYLGNKIESPIEPNVTMFRFQIHAGRGAVSKPKYISFNDIRYRSGGGQVVFVDNFPNAEVTPNNKAKIRAYLRDNDLDYDVMYLSGKVIGSPWLDTFPRIDWNDIQAVKLNKKNAVSYKDIAGSYYVWGSKNCFYESEDITAKQIVYFSSADQTVKTSEIQNQFPDAAIVQINRNRWNKFIRDYPRAQHLVEATKEKLKNIIDSLSEDDKMYLSATASDKDLAGKLDTSKIDDPEIVNFLQIITQRKGVSSKKIDEYKDIRGFMISAVHHVPYDIDVDVPTRNYKHLHSFWVHRDEEIEDIYEYLNALYHYRKGDCNEV